MDSTHHAQPATHDRPLRRRPRQPVKRPRTIRFALTDEEFSEVGAAADQAGLARVSDDHGFPAVGRDVT